MSDNAPNTVAVIIMDKEYLVACPPEAQQQLLNAARNLDEKMREIRQSGKIYGAERIAVMAALNMSHELLETSAVSSTAEIYLRQMDDKLTRILSPAEVEDS